MSDERITQFLFSVDRAALAQKDLELKIEALDNRIQRIVDRFRVRDIPIVGHILGLTHDLEELTAIGKALQHVAPLVAEHDDLEEKLSVVKLAAQNPNWLAYAFGDFGEELNTFIAEVAQSTDEERNEE